MTENDLIWLAGLLEAEGCFLHGTPSAPRYPHIQMMMTDEDVLARAAGLLGVSYRLVRSPSRGSHFKPIWHVVKRGSGAVTVMLQILPYMSARRSAKIQVIVAKYREMKARVRPTKLNAEKAQQIRTRWLAGEFNQSKLAREYGVSPNTIWKVLSGWIHNAA